MELDLSKYKFRTFNQIEMFKKKAVSIKIRLLFYLLIIKAPPKILEAAEV